MMGQNVCIGNTGTHKSAISIITLTDHYTNHCNQTDILLKLFDKFQERDEAIQC